ncbi:TonB-dependent receptor plug domain-containing protein [Bizionia argentinensis]|uniref:TonB-dependent receptor plug domain-containing protein n=1 Tax=Bizionia argentinensis TaxID=456455 RepID=UPI00058BAB10|nr:TonB-dependent receptor plug domain-containing protein [Bizionia argentinensis]
MFASKISENPLIIIDGKVATKNAMDKLNPNSINSVNILKDKTATIKYGNKGKNGVIIITTKK